MKSTVMIGLCVAALSAPAFAQSATPAAMSATPSMAASPSGGSTVTNYYKQSVYSPDQTNLGKVDDVLIDSSGRVSGLVLGVGGFLGVASKDVIVPFTDVTMTRKDNKNWLTMTATKDQLKAAPGYTYDSETTMWTPAKS